MKSLIASKQKVILANGEFQPVIVYAFIVTLYSAGLFYPTLAHASVESSLQAVQEKLVGTILPLAAMCGLVVAGISFVSGSANARQHLIYAVMGAIVGFGAESIVSFIRNLIH